MTRGNVFVFRQPARHCPKWAICSLTTLTCRPSRCTTEARAPKAHRVRFGPKTARALSRYLRARDKHKGAGLPNLWLAERGTAPLTPNGIKIRFKALWQVAGVPYEHAHRWRHSFARRWRRGVRPCRLVGARAARRPLGVNAGWTSSRLDLAGLGC